jgi:hypothetical protein
MAASDRRLRANRANAARSTGPRTKAGKAATRLNALRHGLAAASHYEPDADEEIEVLARAVVGAQEGSELLALARQVADAELALRRVRSAQMALVNPQPHTGRPRADSSGEVDGASPSAAIRQASLGKDLAGALARYERRARSRRRFTIRDYDAARAELLAQR